MDYKAIKNTYGKENRRDLLYLILILLLGFLLRVSNLRFQSIWFDEYVIIANAKITTLGEYLKILKLNSPDYGVSPLAGIIFYLWINLFPNLEWIWRLLPITFGLFSIIVLYYFGKSVVGKKSALLACIFFCLSPFNIWFHQEIKCYAFLQFFVLLAFFSLYKFIENKRGKSLWLIIGFLSNMVMPWFHVVYATVPIFQIPIVLIAGENVGWKKKIYWISQSILSIFIWIIWFFYQNPFMYNLDSSNEERASVVLLFNRLFGNDSVGLSEELLPAWKTNLNYLLSNFWNSLLSFQNIYDNFLSIILFLSSFIFLIIVLLKKIVKSKKKENGGSWYLFWIFLCPILCFLLLQILLHKPIFHPLYFFYLLPIIYLFASSTLLDIPIKNVSRILTVFLIALFIVQSLSFNMFKNRTDYKNAIRYIEKNATIGDSILGHKFATFWDVGKIYKKREDLNFIPYFSFYDVANRAEKELRDKTSGNNNRVWILCESYPVMWFCQCDPITILNNNLQSQGFNTFWKLFPGHYNLYVGLIEKNREFENNKEENDEELNLGKVDFGKVAKDLGIPETEKSKYEKLLKDSIFFWPMSPYILSFLINDLLIEGEYVFAEKLIDYMIREYPNYINGPFLKAVYEYKIGNIEKSKNLFDEIWKMNKDYETIYKPLVLPIFSQQDNVEEINKTFKTLKKYENDGFVLLTQGLLSLYVDKVRIKSGN